jgi:hypothetical protein
MPRALNLRILKHLVQCVDRTNGKVVTGFGAIVAISILDKWWPPSEYLSFSIFTLMPKINYEFENISITNICHLQPITG